MDNATHTVSLGGETQFANLENYQAICDSLVARFPDLGPPKVLKIEAPEVVTSESPAMESQLSIETPKAPEPGRGVTVSAEGASRSLMDSLTAQANGFAPKPPIFTRGTMVIDVGVENARLSRVDHEKKPLVEQACVEFIQRIRDEARRDITFPAADLRFNNDGQVLVPTDTSLRPVGPLSARGFRSFVARTGIGGADYLQRVPARLRAVNLNNWLAGKDGLLVPEGDIKLRTRRSYSDSREVFAVVSPKYTSFDADRIAAELLVAVEGTEARGSVVYDGDQVRFEALWHSDVQPEDYVAGEFFKAGIVIRTADDGTGSCRVSAVVWQNLCLNLIVIDEAEQELARIRHMGTEQSIAERLRTALEQANDKVAAFVKKWGYACREDLIKQATNLSKVPYSVEEVIPGFFNGVIERELVPVRGKRQDVVRSLVLMYEKDKSSATRNGFTRAALANAFTRWAHEVNTDPWLEDEVQRAAGALVQSVTPLPFEPIELKG
jgi:hypothetical protein